MQSLDFVEVAAKLPSYEWSEIKTNIEKLVSKLAEYNPDTFIATVAGTIASINFCERVDAVTGESWYYTRTMELINKALS